MDLFIPGQRFYKGNLHTHTTVSDGCKTPQEAVAAYRARGYDFMAITDHRTFYPTVCEDDFVILGGTELDHQDMETRRAFHIVGLGLRRAVECDDSTQPQEMISRIRAAGGIAVAAHPMWSLLTHGDLLALEGYDHIEVYNTLSEVYSCHGFSDGYLDVLMSKGTPKKMLAVDDCHYYQRDFAGGFIRLQCESLTPECILEAIKSGLYYSSMGPELLALRVGEDEKGLFIEAESSDVEAMAFVSDAFYAGGRVVYGEDGAPVTRAVYRPDPLDRYVRVELWGQDGKKAWSNYISLQTRRFA